MTASTANSTWPNSILPSVSYAQVGDLFKLVVQHGDAEFTACDFCRTLNSHSATRCSTCGGVLSPPDEEPAPAAHAASTRATTDVTAPDPDARALRSVLTLVVLPPLILFAAFGAWHELQRDNERSAAETSKHLSASGASVAPARTAPPVVAATTGVTPIRSNAAGTLDNSAPEALASAENEADEAPPRSMARTPNRGKSMAAAPARARENPVAMCSTYSFLAKAVCINTRCAEPKAARSDQCREALRQRRIDEARRNPTLMG